MKVHVTGARGFLGRDVVQSLMSLGDVRGSDVDDLDIARASQVLARLRVDRPDVVIHLAALKGNVPSRQRPVAFFRVNTLGTLNLLEACRRLGISRFIFMSSVTVVGHAETPADESWPIRPLHPYAASKAAAEALVHAYARSYGIRAVILRPNFIVGAIPPPHPYRDNLIYDFVAKVDRRGALELIGDPGFQREWLHPSDISRAVQLAVEADLPDCETFMLSANRCTMWELAELIVRRVGCGRVTVDPAGAGFTLISSSAKAHRLLGWQPRVTLDEIVAEIWEEYRSRSGRRREADSATRR